MELTIDELQEIVNIRCLEIGELVMKIYNNNCPICYDPITTNNYKILHPCAHILCNKCTVKIAPINMTIRIPCPICRKPSKWIDSVNNNLRQVSSIGNATVFDNNFLPLQPIPMRRLQTTGYAHNNHNNNNNNNHNIHDTFINDEILFEPLVSKQPITDDIFLNQNNIIKAGYSKILYKQKNIGSLIISCNNEIVYNGKDYIFLIDNSGSMDEIITYVKTNIINLISKLTPKDRVSVIFFDSNAKQLFALQPMTSTIKEQVCNIINDELIGSTTNYKNAFILLKKVIREGYIPGRQIVVIFGSDGMPDGNYEGTMEIQDLYETDIIFQIYSCSFGGSVSATVLQAVLKSNNQENYRHFENNDQFEYFIKNDLECDNSQIIASDIKIISKNIKPHSSQTMETDIENTYETDINILKSIDFVFCPLEFIDEDFEINIFYKNTNNEIVELECPEIIMDNGFIKYTYNYKIILKMINDINESTIQNNLKIIELEEIKNAINIDDYGNFLSEIINLLNETIRYMTQPIINNDFNTYNNIRQYTSNNSSCRSTSIGMVYPIEEDNDNNDDGVFNL